MVNKKLGLSVINMIMRLFRCCNFGIGYKNFIRLASAVLCFQKPILKKGPNYILRQLLF